MSTCVLFSVCVCVCGTVSHLLSIIIVPSPPSSLQRLVSQSFWLSLCLYVYHSLFVLSIGVLASIL